MSRMYVRVVNPAAQARSEDEEDRVSLGRHPFRAGGAARRRHRAAESRVHGRPGTYDVYIAMKERLPEKAPKDQVAKMGVLKTQVTVPDFWSGELATSSIIVADKVNVLTAAPGPEEARERPFVFGAQELIPAADMVFQKTEQLATFFQVYNASLDSAGKPNLVMEYNFHRKEGGAEKFFNKTNPQNINAVEPAADLRPGEVPGAGRHRGAAGELPGRGLPPGNQDHRQELRQGRDQGRELHGQSGVRWVGVTAGRPF